MAELLADIGNIISLVKFASTTKEADGFIREFTTCSTTQEKLDFVLGNFDVQIIGREEPDGRYPDDEGDKKRLEGDYEAALHAIVNKKWRQ